MQQRGSSRILRDCKADKDEQLALYCKRKEDGVVLHKLEVEEAVRWWGNRTKTIYPEHLRPDFTKNFNYSVIYNLACVSLCVT